MINIATVVLNIEESGDIVFSKPARGFDGIIASGYGPAGARDSSSRCQRLSGCSPAAYREIKAQRWSSRAGDSCSQTCVFIESWRSRVVEPVFPFFVLWQLLRWQFSAKSSRPFGPTARKSTWRRWLQHNARKSRLDSTAGRYRGMTWHRWVFNLTDLLPGDHLDLLSQRPFTVASVGGDAVIAMPLIAAKLPSPWRTPLQGPVRRFVQV